MAEPLKNQFGPEIIAQIARMFSRHAPNLDWRQFSCQARRGYDELELMPRARHIADFLAKVLPPHFPEAIELLIASLGPADRTEQNSGMEAFVYLPHCLYVARYGLERFDAARRADYELTQRLAAEFSVRPFIERYPQTALKLLEQWVEDPNVHVRRLVDLRDHYVKADGKSAPKVFKLRGFELGAGERRLLSYPLSLRQMTTRKHHAGRHRVEALVNGLALPVADFAVVCA